MPVSEKQVAALRAQLAGQYDEHKRLIDTFDNQIDGPGYATLVAAGLMGAVERRFSASVSTAEIVDFVADVRAQSEAFARDLDPKVAERLIEYFVEDTDISDIDDSTVRRSQIILLGVLVYDEQFSDVELDAFLETAREDADAILD